MGRREHIKFEVNGVLIQLKIEDEGLVLDAFDLVDGENLETSCYTYDELNMIVKFDQDTECPGCKEIVRESEISGRNVCESCDQKWEDAKERSRYE